MDGTDSARSISESYWNPMFVPSLSISIAQELRVQLQSLGDDDPRQQDIVLSRFTALYLPKTVERILDPPSTGLRLTSEQEEDFFFTNAYFQMLVMLLHFPYLFQYCRSSKPAAAPGKRLPGLIAERLSNLSPAWRAAVMNPSARHHPERDYQGPLVNALQIISTFCVERMNDPLDTIIPSATQDKLKPFLTDWANQRENVILAENAARMSLILGGTRTGRGEMRRVRRWLKNAGTCALPICNAAENLKACARCRTVRYVSTATSLFPACSFHCQCCPEHQTQHWSYHEDPTHKQMCFKTEY